MAKYKFEKYILKWDETKWNVATSKTNPTTGYKINFDGTLTEIAGIHGYEVGDIRIATAVKSTYESDKNVPIYYVRDKVSDGILQSNALGSGYGKSQLLTFIQKGDLIDTIVADESEYPVDGIQDGYWYVRGEKAFPSLRLNNLTIGGAKIKDSTGQMRAVANVYFKDSSGTVRNLK